jgi:hypothetical protein
VADQNSPCCEENPDSSPDKVQRQIAFDAGENIGRMQPATPEESRTAEVNPPPTWADLVAFSSIPDRRSGNPAFGFAATEYRRKG